MSIKLRNPLFGIVALVDAAGGKIESRVRIQKIAYLLGIKSMPNFDTAGFSYHYYGPYSRELSDSLQTAVNAHLVHEDKEFFPNNSSPRYSYEITDEGRKWLDSQEFEYSGDDRNTIKSLSDQHWRSLELAATVSYLEKNEPELDREAAFERAIQLKPDCEPSRDKANATLDQLGV